MKFLIDLYNKLMGEREPVLEDAIVKYDKVLVWVDRLYKNNLQDTYEEAQKRLQILEGTSESLAILLAELKKTNPKNQRIDVLTKVTNRKVKLMGELKKIQTLLVTVPSVQELYECYEFKLKLNQAVQDLQVVREDVSEVLSKYIPDAYVIVVKIADTLDKTHEHLSEIFSRQENKSYIKAIKLAEGLKERREKRTFYEKKIAIIEKEIEIEGREADGYAIKISKIKKDPKYAMEFEVQKVRQGVNYYDLKVKELQRKRVNHTDRIKTLQDHLSQLKEQHKIVNPASTQASLKKRIKEDHGIELELVE